MEPGRINYKNPSAFMLFLMVFFVGFSVVSELVVYALIQNGVPAEVFASMWFLIIVQIFRLLLPLIIWLCMTKDNFTRHMPNQPLDKLNFIYIFFISILAIPALMFISGVTSQFLDNEVAEVLAAFTGAGHSWLMLMLAIAVTPAIVEEIVFRGYIQSTTSGTIRKVALFNGLLFGLMHLNLHQFLYTFILGIVFAYMVYYTRSIWTAVFSHFIVNGVNVSLMYWVMHSYEYLPETADQTISQMVYQAIAEIDPALAQSAYEFLNNINIELFVIGVVGFLAIFATACAMALFHVFVRHNQERNKQFDKEQYVNREPEFSTNELAATEYSSELPERSKIDWYLALVIVIYAAFAIALPRV
ncbi:MAG: CPBP family intramembrane metalloprotease [Firmicutes bacterium]|nr:CPBP family intramembrane metalloprotease [Bacillota bacterium]